jgi:hypothetical protein
MDFLPHTCQVPRPSHHASFDHRNNHEILTMHTSPVSSYFLPLSLETTLSTLFFNSCSPNSSLSRRQHVSHPYKITSDITIQYISVLMFFDSKRKMKQFWTERQQEFPRFALFLNYLCMQFRIIHIIPKYTHFAAFSKDSLAAFMPRFCPAP